MPPKKRITRELILKKLKDLGMVCALRLSKLIEKSVS